jgi:hypothetical protein
VQHEDFCSALKGGKAVADEKVVRALYQRALGYEYDTEKIFQYEGQEVRVPYREKMPPDTTACIFWLKNRKKAEWRDGVDVQHDATSAFLQVLDSFGHKGRPRLSAKTLAKRHPGRD